MGVLGRVLPLALGIDQRHQIAPTVVGVAHGLAEWVDAGAGLRQAVVVAVLGAAAGAVGEMGDTACCVIAQPGAAAIRFARCQQAADGVVLISSRK